MPHLLFLLASPCSGSGSLNHWTAREVPPYLLNLHNSSARWALFPNYRCGNGGSTGAVLLLNPGLTAESHSSLPLYTQSCYMTAFKNIIFCCQLISWSGLYTCSILSKMSGKRSVIMLNSSLPRSPVRNFFFYISLISPLCEWKMLPAISVKQRMLQLSSHHITAIPIVSPEGTQAKNNAHHPITQLCSPLLHVMVPLEEIQDEKTQDISSFL